MISPFARLGLLCVRAPRRTLLATALLTALMVPGIAQISVVGDLHRLIPQRSEASTGLALALEGLTRSDAVYGLLEGPADSALLLEVGATLAAELEAGELVRSTRYRPAEGIPDVDPLLVFDVADPAAEQALRERLDPARAPQRAEFLRQVLSGPTGSDARAWVLRDPFGLIELLGQRVARGVQRMDTKEQAFLAPTGRALLLVIEPAYSGMGRDFHEPLHAELTSTVARVLAGHPRGGELTVGFTGSFMHAREIAKATSADSTVLTTASILSVLAIYLLFYRSLASLALVLMLLPLSAVWTLGFGGYAIGELTPMAAGFAAILFGLGVDPAIHVISRYRESRLTLPVVEAADDALKAVASAVAMSGLTTAAALVMMAVFDPKGMGQMGVLSGVGVFFNNALMLTLLPALLVLLGERLTPDVGVGAASARVLARLVHRMRGPIVLVALLIAVGLSSNWHPLRFDASMDAFQPEGLEPVRVDRALERHFGEERGKLLVLLRGADREAVLAANDAWMQRLDRLVEDGSLRAAESLGILRPSDATASARRARLARELDLPAAAAALQAALVERGFRAEPFASALGALAAVGPDPAFDPGAVRRAREADEAGRRSAAADAGLSFTPSWAEWLDAKHLAQMDGELRVVSRAFPLAGEDGTSTAELLRQEAPAPIDGVQTYITGLPLVERENAARFEDHLGGMLLLGMLGLSLVLITHYRRLRPALIGLLPLVFTLFSFMAFHAAFEVRMTLFALASLPLLIGIGIDDHLFMLDRYLEGGSPGRLDDSMASTGRAVLVTTLTTVAAFGVLSLSRFEALASLGRAVIIALSLSWMSSVILMPALLSLFMPGPDAPKRHRG